MFEASLDLGSGQISIDFELGVTLVTPITATVISREGEIPTWTKGTRGSTPRSVFPRTRVDSTAGDVDIHEITLRIVSGPVPFESPDEAGECVVGVESALDDRCAGGQDALFLS